VRKPSLDPEVLGRDLDRALDHPNQVGGELAPISKPQPDGTLVKALARAWRWQRMLDDGVYASVSEIGAAENISKSYVSRILRLALLAPDIVERVIDGGPTAGLAQRLGQVSIEWEKQREQFLVICTQRIDPQPRAKTLSTTSWPAGRAGIGNAAQDRPSKISSTIAR
jgi:ParB-like chromosome segregation protein Spo0J